jgi:hypothetical protein
MYDVFIVTKIGKFLLFFEINNGFEFYGFSAVLLLINIEQKFKN